MRQIALKLITQKPTPKGNLHLAEIACVELKGYQPTGNIFRTYIRTEPDAKPADAAALSCDLADAVQAVKPQFADVATPLKDFLVGAELVTDNTAADIALLETELKQLGYDNWLGEHCDIVNIVGLAHRMRLIEEDEGFDSLCARFTSDIDDILIDDSALQNAMVLAAIYTKMRRLLTGNTATNKPLSSTIRAPLHHTFHQYDTVIESYDDLQLKIPNAFFISLPCKVVDVAANETGSGSWEVHGVATSRNVESFSDAYVYLYYCNLPVNEKDAIEQQLRDLCQQQNYVIIESGQAQIGDETLTLSWPVIRSFKTAKQLP